MNQSTLQAFVALLAKLSLILGLLAGTQGAAINPNPTFGAGVGSAYTGIAAIAPNPAINSPVCPIATSNLDSSVGLNTCPSATAVYIVSSTYPTSALTLGPIGASTSTTSTALSILAGSSSTPALNFGDPCQVLFSSVPATAFSLNANITALSTSTATATVTLTNDYSTSVTINTTSTSGSSYASSTVKVICSNSVN